MKWLGLVVLLFVLGSTGTLRAALPLALGFAAAAGILLLGDAFWRSRVTSSVTRDRRARRRRR